ncbi:radical SAM family heme chaperone HemW [Candidatus Saganbacteria bacterium]|nr:radical SAM family heme chaperone HemW [Candidatus Saganbacteria bacterium]
MRCVYIHIPFCRKKCDYCDFVSYAGKEELIDRYVEALIKEINSPPPFGFPPLLLREGDKGGELETLFIGGGTPTLLESAHFEKIISSIICHLSLDICHSEITVEANPKTADRQKLQALKELGVNRLSIGAQSFNDRHLKTLGRIHDSADILRFYDDARSIGFENISLDLIFAIPGQTLEEWQTDLKTAIGLRPNHLSTYNLTIEESTPLHEEITNNRIQITNNETEATMFEYSIEALVAAGYQHYEISNFARPGFECQHNLNYWKNGNYIGIGAGAHSHINGQRWSNTASIEEYINTPSSFLPLSKGENAESALADEARGGQRETLFLGLRMLDGLSAAKFQGFEEEVNQLLNEGLLARNHGHYHLTRRGIMLGNQVFERFV